MGISENTRKTLQELTKEYKKSRAEGTLSILWAKEIKKAYAQTLKNRINQIEDEEFAAMDESMECEFLAQVIENGWLPDDMEMMMELYDAIGNMPPGPAHIAGDNLLQELYDTKIDEVGKRAALLSKCAGYLNALGKNEEYGHLHKLVNESLGVDIVSSEYPEDEELHSYYDTTGKFDANRTVKVGSPVEDYEALYKMALRYNNAPDKLNESIRMKEDYVLSMQTDEKLEQFKINEGQKANKIKKSNRTAIKEVYGDDIYDEIDEMKKGSDAERTIKIHHSMGNKWMREGCDVLEIDFAGSGYKEIRKEYHGQHGKKFSDGTVNPTETLEAEFGTLVDKPGGGKYSHLRSKTVPIKVNGEQKYKTRYTIAGPTPDLPFKPGLLNWGEYSIENTRVYGKNFAVKFITDIFKKWDDNKELPHDIHINLTGHSRGAVSAGESIKLMSKWLKDYAAAHKDKAHYVDKVKFDLVLRDPVPGFITKWFHKKNDLRSVPNLNTTVFCSMAQEHKDYVFPLQKIRGAKRLIIGTTGHNMDLGQMDLSQTDQPQDGKAHKSGFYDAETGEMFRGSGLNQMPEGAYITDEKMNLIRISSYSQIGKLINSVYDGKSKQKGRVENIHKMVRDWFIDNDLKMSFTDEDERARAAEDNSFNMTRILRSKNKRLIPVQEAISNLLECRSVSGGDTEQVRDREQELINACREYMKKTSIPAKGDSEYRMNLVSDLLTFTMKDRNYIDKKLHPERRNEGTELDEKIKAHKERLANKEGYQERKLEKEEKRLANDKNVLKVIKDTAENCDKYVKILKETRKNKSTSDTYDHFLGMLEKGSRLDEKTTIDDFKKFIEQMVDTSYDYIVFHDSPIGGPITKGGQRRVEASKHFLGYGIELRNEFKKLTQFIPEKDKSIGKIIVQREQNVKKLNQKLNPAPNPEIQANQPKKESKPISL